MQRLNLQVVQLAVLSACQTGLGQIHDAGIIGLARAVQIAGVIRVLILKMVKKCHSERLRSISERDS
ncbi:CHAT domain-containing protein [Trichormus azollae]|uniref:CHAT domain-containing protein n=1 Tax=Trichormus azollae TaxID=1164 RepID=UPI003D328705